MSEKYFVAIFIFVILVCLAPFLALQAQAATLYFSPASGSFAQGESFWLAIMVNTGTEAVNAIGAYLSYPEDKLEPLGISTTGSVMTLWAEKNMSAGKIEISGGLPTPGFSGVKKVAAIGFKVKTSSGSVTLQFNENSAVLTDVGNQNILSLGSSGQGQYTFKPKTVSPPPTAPATSTLPATSTQPAPETPAGYQVALIVLNQADNKPLSGAEVSFPKLSSATKTTDSEGKVIFDNLTLGAQQVSVKYKKAAADYQIEIIDQELTQSFNLFFKVPGVMGSLPFLIFITVVLLGLAGFLVVKILKPPSPSY